LKYDKLIDYYQKLFGKENILALPYEMFIKNPGNFLHLLTNFIGNKNDGDYEIDKIENFQHYWINLYIMRFFNLIMGNPTSFEGKLIQKLRNFSRTIAIRLIKIKFFNNYINEKYIEYISSEINNYYKKSNENTSKLISLNLDHYNY
jgi:hypothetical protein